MQGVRRRGPDENLAEWVVEITSAAHKAHSDMFVEGYARYCLQCCWGISASSWSSLVRLAGPQSHRTRARPLLTSSCTSMHLTWGVVKLGEWSNPGRRATGWRTAADCWHISGLHLRAFAQRFAGHACVSCLHSALASRPWK